MFSNQIGTIKSMHIHRESGYVIHVERKKTIFPNCNNFEVCQDDQNYKNAYSNYPSLMWVVMNVNGGLFPCYSTSGMKCYVLLSYFFCQCESHDVYFLYAISTLYVFNFFTIQIVVVLNRDEIKCLESMEMGGLVLVYFISINIVNNLMLKALATHTIQIFN